MAKVTGGAPNKLSKIKSVRKGIARVLTVFRQTQRSAVKASVEEAAQKKKGKASGRNAAHAACILHAGLAFASKARSCNMMFGTRKEYHAVRVLLITDFIHHACWSHAMQALLPLDMRAKRTRAIRKRLTKEQVCNSMEPGQHTWHAASTTSCSNNGEQGVTRVCMHSMHVKWGWHSGRQCLYCAAVAARHCRRVRQHFSQLYTVYAWSRQ